MARTSARKASSRPAVYAALAGFQLAPDQILLALSLEFTDDLRTPEIEAAVVELERRIREAHPEVVTTFVKPQTPGTYQEIVRRRYGEDPNG